MDILIRFLNGFLMIAIPLALGVILINRSRKPWRLFGIGILAFVGSQVLHLPFNAYVLAPFLQSLSFTPTSQSIIVGISVGLSAGVFEEVARYVAFRGWIKDDRDWAGALVFGAGHGGIEAIILGGFALYALIQAVSLRNGELTTLVPVDQLQIVEAQLTAYWNAPWYVAILGALERIFALCIHLCASVMVLQVFKRNNIVWLFGAITWHALANASVYIALLKWNIFVSEGIVGIFAVLSILLILYLRPAQTQTIPSSQSTTPPPIKQSPTSDISQEKIEDSRYA